MADLQTFIIKSQADIQAALAGLSEPLILIGDGNGRGRMATNADLAFNADLDLAGVPEHLHPWAKRWKPILRNPNAHVMVTSRRGMVVNSMLDKREWARLDRKIFEMVKLRKNAVADLVSAGLTDTTSLGEMLSQWRMASERQRPSVSMDGRTRANRDRTDRLVFSSPIPIYRTDYSIGTRELDASRLLSTPLDTFEAGEATEAVVEEEERTLMNGNANIVVDGNTIFGYTTLPARDTATAAAYGGGDFGTISNIEPTFLGMLTALALVRYYGPFTCYVARTQYHQMLSTYTDGSGQNGLNRVLLLPQIESIKQNDFLAAGNIIMVQLTENVVDWRIGMSLTNREWTSGDEQEIFFAVLAASTPRLKTDVDGRAGIAHATAA